MTIFYASWWVLTYKGNFELLLTISGILLLHTQLLLLLTLKGAIQQLRGSNFTQFRLPNPLEWTKMVILHTIYSLSHEPTWTIHWPPPPHLVHVAIEWLPTYIKVLWHSSQLKISKHILICSWFLVKLISNLLLYSYIVNYRISYWIGNKIASTLKYAFHPWIPH